ncbi:Activating signal cointegrator 1 [Myotis davidii]|uniref:Activating signal cointegrator 1 n=1 Tax=Myotis davidii TaxID=225400 RepID=L5M4X7_MYODS|nr:Activating signal cointegrator 1 [Myotis davidii]
MIRSRFLMFCSSPSKTDDILDGQRSGDQLKRRRQKGRNRQEAPAFAGPDTTIEVKTPFDLAKAQGNNNSLKKKTKFVSLYTKEGQDKLAVLIPGRHPCDCLGQKHKVINNCVICGRIACVLAYSVVLWYVLMKNRIFYNVTQTRARNCSRS